MVRRPPSRYRELPPPAALAPYVSRLWLHELGPGDVAYEQPVLPDGCVDLVAVGDQGVELAGPATGPVVLHLDPGTVTVGVRFHPGAAPALIGERASDLRDQNVPLQEVWGRLGADVAERAAGNPAPAGRLAAMVDALEVRLGHATAVDPVGTGIARLLSRSPGAPLHDVAGRFGLSDRQLRRRVEVAVGYPPRTLGRILRFQRFLEAARSSTRARDLAGLAAATGYADQAHLTRESRRLAGLPPAALLDWEAERLER
ncbi:MAG TPA: helix-turn-helix domain-containing protein [Acidimicrobiales bacterium]|nr:helix-turn-helix domain-containing protein [Acidimicrobiales bacterium]